VGSEEPPHVTLQSLLQQQLCCVSISKLAATPLLDAAGFYVAIKQNVDVKKIVGITGWSSVLAGHPAVDAWALPPGPSVTMALPPSHTRSLNTTGEYECGELLDPLNLR